MALSTASTGYAGDPPKIPEGNIPNVEATVNHSPMGCWVLQTKFGLLEPTNLTPEFEVENLKVIVTIRERVDLATTCMVGKAILTISNISRSADSTK
jgi:hypothetical protein